jgi:DNA polymerase I
VQTIKSFFIARPKHALVQADYSQIELRIGAFLSRDSSMLSLLRGGVDLHSATAGRLFSCDLGEVTKDQRYLAKTINFGIFYGMGPKRFHEETGIPMKQASQFIKSWYAAYPGVKCWLESVEKELIEKGHVTSIFGRRRRLPLNVAKDEGEYRHMLRQACNFPVQSVASELTQMAMVLIDRSDVGHIVGNVHDSIIVESTRPKACAREMMRVMEHPDEIVKSFGYKIHFDVPTPVEIKVGENWEEMEVVHGK